MRKSLALFVVAVLLSTGVAAADSLQEGVSLTLWHETEDATQVGKSLDDFKAIGGEWVGINLFWFQDTKISTAIAPDTTDASFATASDATLGAVIDAVHARGMKVMLKPMVDVDTGDWRGTIGQGKTGDSAWLDAWFTSYSTFIDHYAGIAQTKGIELLCVGNELATLAPLGTRWRSVVTGVDALYSGPLVYGANHGGTSSATMASIDWWDALDYIGLSAYYPLTNPAVDDPTVAQLRAGWSDRADMIETWLNGLDPADQKPVLFTEVGYRSWDGTNWHPYDGADKGTNDVDQQEQADCYQAFFEELWGEREWLQGAYPWNWEIDPTWENANNPNWYPMQGKLAEDVLRQYYLIPEPAGLGIVLFGIAVLARKARR
jgi:glycosyl hydrolase family 113